MDFEEVKKEHLLQAIKDFEEKGYPNGLSESKYYDVEIEGQLYPPKPIMAYANMHASGKEPGNYFSGGKDTPCFKAFKKHGFDIIEKDLERVNLDEYLREFSTVADNWFQKESWLEEWYQFYQSFFTKENLQKANWEDFQDMGNRIHSFNSMAIAKGNALGNMNLPIEEYRRIFQYIVSNDDPINTIINNLYKKYDGSAYLPYFSDSSISELIAYAFPNKYVLYNRRDLKALEILGLKLENVRGEKFGDLFLRYNEFLQPVLEKYQKIVGKRTRTTIQLELDQFFSWLYINKKADQPIKDLIDNYKKLIRSNGLENEKYKWELIRDSLGKPSLENNLEEELNSIKFNNILYQLAVPCIKGIAREFEKELKIEFHALFDDSIDLNMRISKFNKNTLKLYRKAKGENSHHQDERSISAYLTLHNPAEYTFYKSTYYTEYCKLINEKHAKAKEKYSHYLELIKDLAENYISKDDELIDIVHKELNELVVADPNYLLVAQDMLYQLLDAQRGESYWIFQGNPNVFDFKTALRQEILGEWTVSAHKDKIKVGDKVILWITGDDSGCYALAEITSNPQKKTNASDDHLWKEEDTSELKAGIKITHNLVDSPILKNDIKGEKELEGLNVGHQGTNFNASEEEYLTLLDMVSSQKDSSYQNVINKLDKTLLNEFIKFLRDYVKQKHLDYDDSRIGFNVRVKKDRLVFIIGGRYAFCIEKNNNKTEIKFIHEDPQTNDAKGEFTTNNEIEAYWHRVSTVSKFKHIIKEGLDIELKRGHINPHRKYSNREFIKDIYQKEIMAENKSNQEKSLNTILFGPPGTGKTYHTINKAVEICDPIFYKDNNSNRDELKKRYRDLVEAGQVVFTTFHQSTSYEDFIEGIKPKMDKDNGNLEYQIEDGIFKEISQKAKDQKNAVTNNTDPIEISKDKFDLPVNKISLGDANDKEDDVIVEYCLKNDCIALGFGEDIDFTGVKDIGDIRHRCQEYGIDINGTDKFTAEAVKRFLFWMKKGQLVMISNGNRKLRAIGEITGDYFCDPATPIRYSQFRKVNWLYKDLELPIKEIYGSYFSQQTIYQMHSSKFDLSYFSNSNKTDKSVKNHVIIIDEINRGNVSSIFGELITLIETDKREGNDEALSATLPYSKQSFEVPNNLYIIGTMNTADRSVEALDTALRRRFSFEEMLPSVDELNDNMDGISLKDLLTCINNRIEALIDRDHTIGHSYLINVINMTDLRLAFKDKIIPLLQEYFYGDYGKIGLVLGEGFVEMHPQENEIFAVFDKYEGSEGLAQNKFELKTFKDDKEFEAAIKTLLKE